MATLLDFKRHFGKIRIIKGFKGDNMKVVKRVKLVSVKPSGEGMRYALLTSDGEWYSTFDSKVGSYIESVSEGDTVEIEFIENAKGFKNFSSIKLVDDDEEGSQEGPPPEEPISEGLKQVCAEEAAEDTRREEKPPAKQRRGVDRVDKNRISAGNLAIELMGLLDLSKLKEEGIVEKFKAIWEIIEEEIGK